MSRKHLVRKRHVNRFGFLNDSKLEFESMKVLFELVRARSRHSASVITELLMRR